jgi:PAS domain S-box-containing protein
MAICGLPDMLGKESSKKSGPDDSVGYKLTLNWDAKMEIPANILEPRSLYELCWTYALRSMFAFDTASGELVAGNLAAEELVGFSIEELLGRDITVLHPMEERFRIKAEFQKAGWKPYPLLGFHIQRKDGRCSRVVIWSSKPLVQGSLSLVIYAYFGIPSPEEPKHSI